MQSSLAESDISVSPSCYGEGRLYLRSVEERLRGILQTISHRQRPECQGGQRIYGGPRAPELWDGFLEAYDELAEIASYGPNGGHFRAATVWARNLEQAVEDELHNENKSPHFISFCEKVCRHLLGLIRTLLGDKAAGAAPKAGLSTFNSTQFLAQLTDKGRAKIRRLRREHNKLIGLLSSSIFSCIERK